MFKDNELASGLFYDILREKGVHAMGKEIFNIVNDMSEVLSTSQLPKLQEVLVKRLAENQEEDYTQISNEDFLNIFLTAKHLEGCSEKTLHCYRRNIGKMLTIVNVPVAKITTERLRRYLVEYQQINNCGKVTIDNIRKNVATAVCPYCGTDTVIGESLGYPIIKEFFME